MELKQFMQSRTYKLLSSFGTWLLVLLWYYVFIGSCLYWILIFILTRVSGYCFSALASITLFFFFYIPYDTCFLALSVYDCAQLVLSNFFFERQWCILLGNIMILVLGKIHFYSAYLLPIILLNTIAHIIFPSFCVDCASLVFKPPCFVDGCLACVT